MFSKHRKLCRALYSGYSVIELNKTVIEMNKFCSLSVKHIICWTFLPSSYQDILPTGTEILSPGILSYLYWDFVPWDFVLRDFVPWDSVRAPKLPYQGGAGKQLQEGDEMTWLGSKRHEHH